MSPFPLYSTQRLSPYAVFTLQFSCGQLLLRKSLPETNIEKRPFFYFQEFAEIINHPLSPAKILTIERHHEITSTKTENITVGGYRISYIPESLYLDA